MNIGKSRSVIMALLAIALMGASESGCEGQAAVSSSGVSKASVHVPTGSDGLTTEQRNISDRLKADNEPGAIKHLYVMSAYSGQVLIYSTVRGKVTSGSKRLTPSAVIGINGTVASYFAVDIGKNTQYTSEVLGDDGAYGGSVEYLFWWDTKGVYHQHYVQGGQILHISSEPLSVKSVVINMEITNKNGDAPAEEDAHPPPSRP